MSDLDQRIHPIRADAASDAYRGKVDRPRYLPALRRRIAAASTLLYRGPGYDQPIDSEGLHGEDVDVFEMESGWSWVQLTGDGYVGYIESAALAETVQPAATHHVQSLRTYVYPQPSIKTRDKCLISMNARVSVASFDGQFAMLADGAGYVFAADLLPNDQYQSDFVSVAERFLHTPYRWGGRTSLGLDCSGLVQMALRAAGVSAPRDTDLQERAIGKALPDPSDFSCLQRGDLVFWKGHVGIMSDADTLLHATGHYMRVVAEPLLQAAERIKTQGQAVTGIRRLAGPG